MKKNLYTSGFKLPKAFLIVTALVISLECSFHILEKRIFSYQDFRSDSLWYSVGQAWQHKKINIAIVGNSISQAVSSDYLLPYLDWEFEKPIVVNFDIFAGNPESVYRLLNEVVLPGVKPRLIIYAVGTRDLSSRSFLAEDNKDIPELDLYKRSKTSYFLTTFFQQHCFMYRYRDQIKFWIHNTLFVGNEKKRKDGVDVDIERAKQVQRKLRGIYEQYQIGDQLLSKILQIKNLSVKNGADFILVELPANPRVFSISNFKELINKEKGVLKDFCEKNKINHIDLSDHLLREEYFEDTHHFTDKGARVIAELLARQPQIVGAVSK